MMVSFYLSKRKTPSTGVGLPGKNPNTHTIYWQPTESIIIMSITSHRLYYMEEERYEHCEEDQYPEYR